jgi:hypothetical protein
MRSNNGVETFSLPGFDVEQLLGFGGSGEVWRARERATGELVALKRLRVSAADAETHRQLRRAGALLATVRHEHVVRLRATVPTSDGLVLVLDYAGGGSLASLLAERGRLRSGEVVAVAAPLAVALAEVHGRGVVHGNITPASVLFDGAGTPLLADLGVAALVGGAGCAVTLAPGFADPAVPDGVSVTAADVHGLAAVCHAALTGAAPYRDEVVVPLRSVASGVPPSLVEAIEAAMNRDFRARPDAAGFARALYAACTPRPVVLVDDTAAAPVASEHVDAELHVPPPAPTPPPALPRAPSEPPASRGRHRGAGWRRGAGQPRVGGVASRLPARRLAMPLLAAGLLAAAVLVGVAGLLPAAHDRPAAASAQPSAALASSDTAWFRVMGALDAARDQAFADGDPDELAGVYVAGSAALDADRRTLVAMADAGGRARDLSLKLVSVQARAQTSTSVDLLVRDTLPPYEIVDADGAVRREPGRGEREWLVTLQATAVGGPWRIATIDEG